jgi:hypothetical protein
MHVYADIGITSIYWATRSSTPRKGLGADRERSQARLNAFDITFDRRLRAGRK